ncbi:uncharacterized protein LOC126893407 [Diabrotica virgifera virgifera]|uniref:Uncharacterized protein n=1 Tax=Diabrotica virgifera virgifera TaxID=50390 RepID=A0ABM5LAN8_DIAVI|nr:uncharacterized protein LOC126893407 [Diabrotica virgifera virgifera]
MTLYRQVQMITFDKLLRTYKPLSKRTKHDSLVLEQQSKLSTNQELPTRRICKSSLNNDSLQISTEDTIHDFLNSNSVNESTVFLSNFSLPNDSNSQLSISSHLYYPSTERIEETLEIEVVKKKQPKTTLSYITIPKKVWKVVVIL